MTAPELLHLRALRGKIEEGMGEPLPNDFFWCHHCKAVEPYYLYCCEDEHGSPFIRIPLAIDPERPERGLEGMIDGSITIHRLFAAHSWIVDVTRDGLGIAPMRYNRYEADTPYLALLKALAAQWGVEVEERP